MNEKEIHARLSEVLCEEVGGENIFDRSSDLLSSVEVHPDAIRKAVIFLKQYGADFLDSIHAVDLLGYSGAVTDRSRVPWAHHYIPANTSSEDDSSEIAGEAPEDSQKNTTAPRFFLLQYQLYSFAKRENYILKCVLPFENPAVESIDDIFGNANWLEREVWDLHGISFSRSRDMRRIMMPEDWEGHPLRRDYVQPESYAGMLTSRPSPLTTLTEAAIENVKKWTEELES